jgi:TolB protein
VAHGQRWFLTLFGALAALCILTVGLAVSIPRLIPGGGIIVYTYDTDGIPDIYVLDVARIYRVNLTRTLTLIEELPAWSSDGMRLAYERNTQGTNQLCVLEIGGQIQCFPPHQFFDNSPVWSPDGRWLAFNSAGTEGGNLFLLETYTGEVRRLNLVTQVVRRVYSWSPDSTRLAFSEYRPDGYVELSIVDLASGEIVRRLPDTLAQELLPVWSPDGQRIALITDGGTGFQIYVVNASDTSPARQLTSESGYDLSLSWSPDSSMLLLVSARGGDDFELFSLDPETGVMQALTNNEALDERPTWSPDGQQIAFTSDRDGDVHVYVMNRDGSDVRRLTFAEGRNTDPVWRP